MLWRCSRAASRAPTLPRRLIKASTVAAPDQGRLRSTHTRPPPFSCVSHAHPPPACSRAPAGQRVRAAREVQAGRRVRAGPGCHGKPWLGRPSRHVCVFRLGRQAAREAWSSVAPAGTSPVCVGAAASSESLLVVRRRHAAPGPHVQYVNSCHNDFIHLILTNI